MWRGEMGEKAEEDDRGETEKNGEGIVDRI